MFPLPDRLPGAVCVHRVLRQVLASANPVSAGAQTQKEGRPVRRPKQPRSPDRPDDGQGTPAAGLRRSSRAQNGLRRERGGSL